MDYLQWKSVNCGILIRHFIICRDATRPLVEGFRNSFHKSFSTLEEAEDYMRENGLIEYTRSTEPDAQEVAG